MADSDWSQLDVGNPRMDEGHRRQIQLVDSLIAAIAGDASHRVVEDLLLRLIEETTGHFAAEHDMMKGSGFPDYQAHAREHDSLLRHVSALRSSHAAGKTHLTLEMAKSLVPWLATHIREKDRSLASYLVSLG
jgi:hemerythrin